MTFTLTGFKTFRRDGLELPSEFTATVNAELGVGSLEETITVTGASPVVDVTSTAKTAVLNREAIDLIPTGRSIQGLGQLVVGVSLNLPDTGGARAMQQTYMSTHGMSDRQHHGAGRRPDDQRPAGRRRDPELLQRRDERRDELPDRGDRRRDLVGRRAPQHDSARRRQPVPRRLQGGEASRCAGSRAT